LTDPHAGARLWAALQGAVAQAVVGADAPLRLMTIALLAEGHALLEDVPGVGKTLLARAFARSLGLGFGRVQGTPDLLPSDVTGSSILADGSFRFIPGPIFTNVLLVDEINRATPRTQSALLEAMQERQVSVDGQTRPIPAPFLVLATQNPIELEGTFALPEAQLDRFLVRISLGYPGEADERAIARRQPVVVISCSGGARMMEGALSLMQMAKVCAALARLDRARLPYISVLTDPTTGGVTASFAMLGDLNIAEPGALIGFAGPRVIEQTIRQKLPDGFQRSEFLLAHGMLDLITDRREMKPALARALRFMGCVPEADADADAPDAGESAGPGEAALPH